jgi:hypothetical protein
MQAFGMLCSLELAANHFPPAVTSLFGAANLDMRSPKKQKGKSCYLLRSER